MNRGILLIISIVFSSSVLLGCSSPEEKAQEFYEKGLAFMEKGEYRKARLELRNSLQINKKNPGVYYALAQIAEIGKDWKKHYGYLNNVVELDSNHVDAQMKLAQIYLVSGQLEQALLKTEKLLTIAPDRADVMSTHAALLLKMDRSEEAVKFAEKALKKEPGQVNALMVLAKERLNKKDLEQANKFINEGLLANKDNVPLFLLKLQSADAAGDSRAIEETLLKLIELDAENRRFSNLLAQFYLKSGKQDKAQKIFEDIAKNNPDDTQAKIDVVRFINKTKGLQAAILSLQGYLDENPENMELNFALGELYLSANEKNKAVGLYENLIASQDLETRVKAKGQMLGILSEEGKQEEVSKLVEEILAEDPRNEMGLIARAKDQIENKQLDTAISSLRDLLRDKPDSAGALLLLGKAHELSGQKGVAEDMYARAFEASEYAEKYALIYSGFLLSESRTDKAVSVLEESLKKNPENLSLLTQLTRLFTETKDWAKATGLTNRIARLTKGGEISYQLKGAIAEGQEKFDESIEAYKKAYDSFPTTIQPIVSLIRVYTKAGRHADAEAFLDSVIKVSPDNQMAQLLKARLYAVQMKADLANAQYSELIQKNPENAALYLELSRFQLRASQIDEALETLNQGIEAIEQNASLLLAKAGILEGQKNYPEAIDVYEQVLKISPDSVVVINNLVVLLAEHSKAPDALDRAAKLAEVFTNTEVPQFMDTLGWVYYKQGNYDAAYPLLNKAVLATPENIEMRYHLGMTYEALGNGQDAKKQYDEVLKMAGDKAFALREAVMEGIERTANASVVNQ